METENKIVHTYGSASDWVRAEIEAAREMLRDYGDVVVYACKKTGAVYASLPGSYLMTGFSNPNSGGALVLANRAVYWGDVYGGGVGGRWSDWVGRAFADCSADGRVHGLGDDYRGIDGVVWLTGLGAAAKLVLLHSGFGGSEYLIRVDAWDMVAESVGALGDYPCLSDEYLSSAEHEYVWDYVSGEVVSTGLAEGVPIDDIGAFDAAMCAVLHDLDCAYRFEVRSDLSVDDSCALNRDGWRRAITLAAIAWVRGGCCRADVIAAAEWAGAADGDGRYYGRLNGGYRLINDGDIGALWGLAGADGNAEGAERPDYFAGASAWAVLLGDDADGE